MLKWEDTLEITTWLADENFPYGSAESMIEYAKFKWPDKMHEWVESDGAMPQSYTHWWCHSRVAYITHGTVVYDRMDAWKEVAQVWNMAEASDMDVITMFKTWLEMLYVDRLMFDDEFAREDIPRLYIVDGQSVVAWSKLDASTRQSRKQTSKYIIAQGHQLFNERGFVDGTTWWEKECIKYHR